MFVEEKRDGEVFVPEIDVAGSLLLAAAGYLERYGWCQGTLGFDRGPRCGLGALFSVGGLHLVDVTTALIRIHRVLPFGNSLPAWQDQPHITKAMVLSKLREAAGLR